MFSILNHTPNPHNRLLLPSNIQLSLERTVETVLAMSRVAQLPTMSDYKACGVPALHTQVKAAIKRFGSHVAALNPSNQSPPLVILTERIDRILDEHPILRNREATPSNDLLIADIDRLSLSLGSLLAHSERAKEQTSGPVSLADTFITKNLSFPPVKVVTKWLKKNDIPEVLAIESATKRLPWRETDFIQSAKARNHILMVVKVENEDSAYACGVPPDTVLGHVVYRLSPNSFEIRNMAVRPDFWGHSIGRQIISFMKRKLSSGGTRTTLTIDVPEELLSAQVFFRSVDLRATELVLFEDKFTTGTAIRFQHSLPPPKGTRSRRRH